jgi:transposase
MPKYTKPRKAWQYSNEFKVNAALLSLMKVLKLKKSLS